MKYTPVYQTVMYAVGSCQPDQNEHHHTPIHPYTFIFIISDLLDRAFAMELLLILNIDASQWFLILI